MNILFGCEFYAPSVGGVQEVMRQIAERMVRRGHRVTVVTSKLASRDFQALNGVEIKEFAVSGNQVVGMRGEIDEYRRFVLSGQFDVIMLKAAQQWTFDALWSILSEIKARKVFVPCGFSGLYLPAYANYFKEMPEILAQFDHLIFYASDYRDINFARRHGLHNFSVIPNGASEVEFGVEADPSFRQRLGISEADFVFLTVGSFTGLKGHFEVVSAFAKLATEIPAVLILNGNQVSRIRPTLNTKVKALIRSGLCQLGIMEKKDWRRLADKINRQADNKQVIVTDLARADVVQAFKTADLFVFASNVEYSPLVLFEAAAAGTAFLSVPVGNAAEIAQWTGGGEICPASVDRKGYTRVDPNVLAEHMAQLMHEPGYLRELGQSGRRNWQTQFTWDKIGQLYEHVLQGIPGSNN